MHRQETVRIFVEAMPEVQPSVRTGPDGTFEMYMPGIIVKLSTSCAHSVECMALAGFRPYEEFTSGHRFPCGSGYGGAPAAHLGGYGWQSTPCMHRSGSEKSFNLPPSGSS